jgi:adenylate cyclase
LVQEIERKFLVLSHAYRRHSGKKIFIRQGYLCTNPTVRIRIAGSEAFLTIKGEKIGISSAEFEFPIPLADAKALLSMCSGSIVEKKRWHVRFRGKLWEVDEFLGDNRGLVIAEIELKSEKESFPLPPWLGKEVTHQKKYTNASLAFRPFKDW